MKKILHVAFIAFCCMTLQAQTYTFSLGNQTYNNLTAPTSLNGTATWDDPSFEIPLGFNFNFFNSAVTALYISDEGVGGLLLPVAQTTGSHFAMLPFGADIVDRGYVIEDGLSPTGSQSNISYQLEGVMGSRILKIEWNNVGFYGDIADNNSSNDFANFQLWLYETSNIFEIHFGPSNIADADASFDGETGPPIAFAPEVNFDTGEFSSNSIVMSGPADNPVANLTTEELYLTGMPSNGITYRFTPASLQVNESQKKDFSMYPNPVRTTLNLKFAADLQINSIEVVDLTGKIVQKVGADYDAINVASLTNGIYVLRMTTATGVLTQKFVKI